MDIRVLRYFITVANQESISGAANYLHLSQPTLSRQLNDLEKELGATLFTRGNRKISLTEEGMFLLEKAKEIVNLVDKTEANFNQAEEIIRGEIYIGGGETEAMSLIAKTLKEVLTVYPDIKFHTYSGNADDIASKLDSGLLDFGIVIEPADKQKYNYIQLPATDTWGVLMLKTSPLADKPFIEPKDLVDKPLIISRQTANSNELAGWFGQEIESLNIIGTYNLLYNASLMVKENIGYALCIDKLINTTGDSDLCFRPLSPKLEASLNIIWKKHQTFSKAATKFLHQLRKNI
ncbi:LysR family transcriptional regulator [Oceanobacillus sp. J11TS1]|uniref:LysR family transcriptional regulator n=1 Tax=Oceanobacillus sp. J11TS1 TaxID=2807191 RepID=UPI001B0F3512|nr:LysR family transcriptional regulator [Oceanobacillus sp. J11TS1]GIO25256.1 LysR family transcriptional regulator [Oceanobacillus sp. J11TS1]